MTSLQQRIAGTETGGTVVLGDEPMGDVRLARLDGRGVKVVGGRFRTMAWFELLATSFEGPRFDFTPDETTTSNTQALRAVGCAGVTMSDFAMTGGAAITGVESDAERLDRTGNVIGLPTGKAINLSQCRDMVLDTGSIENFHKGVLADRCEGIEWRSLNVARLRTTGFTWGNGSGLTMERCSYSDSSPWNVGGTGDHCDGFHAIITIEGLVQDRLTLRDNAFTQGAGAPCPMVLLDNWSGRGGGYTNVLVEGNLIHGGHAFGIAGERIIGGRIADNDLRWSGDRTVPKTKLAQYPTGFYPTAELAAYSNVPRIMVTDGSRDVEFAGNRPDRALPHELVSLYKLTEEEKASMRFIEPFASAARDPKLEALAEAARRFAA